MKRALGSQRALLRAWSASRYTCPSCRLRGLTISQPRRKQSTTTSEARRGWTASSTAANRPMRRNDISPIVRDLYESLEILKQKAGSYVNLSRLQLALQGLETRGLTRRIAVLGLDDIQEAKNLVRVLLADVLVPETEWERALTDEGDPRALLIRYAESPEDSSGPTLRTIGIPSPMLRSGKLELLVSTLPTGPATAEDTGSRPRLDETILTPALETSISGDGRFSYVNFPVHGALLVGDGPGSTLRLGRYLGARDLDQLPKGMTKVFVNTSALGKNRDNMISSMDVNLAASAVSTFRQSLSNATEYETKWFQSGVANVIEWLGRDDSSKSQGQVHPLVRVLIKSILDGSREQLNAEEADRLRILADSVISEETRQSKSKAIDFWAERAHRELRDDLEAAFEGKTWARSRWWRLFWRADDVDAIASDILERRWLADAEKGIIWNGGRLYELRSSIRPWESQEIAPDGKSPQSPSVMSLNQVSLARRALIASTIPDLQSKAQGLLVKTVSNVGITSALASLVYLSSYGVYESVALGLFGLVWSLRRMQKQWEFERNKWTEIVREEGRQTLRASEHEMRTTIDDLGKPDVEIEGAEARRIAREAIEAAQKELEAVI